MFLKLIERFTAGLVSLFRKDKNNLKYSRRTTTAWERSRKFRYS